MEDRKTSNASPSNRWAEIKNHPVVIVAGACIATTGIVSVFYTQYELPHRTLELTRQIASFSELEKKIAEEDASMRSLKQRNTELSLRLIELSKENGFANDDDPHPKYFRSVRVGDPLGKIDQVYGARAKHVQ